MSVISCSSPRHAVPVSPDARASWFVNPNRLLIRLVRVRVGSVISERLLVSSLVIGRS